MFNCTTCNTTAAPRMQSVRIVTAVRPKTYHRLNVETDELEVAGHGHEISKERIVCRSCAGLPPQSDPQPVDLAAIRLIANRAHKHVRECKRAKNFEDCKICDNGVAFFASLSLPVLSRILN